ncbi:MAG: GIY-YIG nuclease family protein [Lachnospiraceae bacterium]|nr:GIY-YIG nuclease family protein [Lachnospiraceae bacterium]
MPYVYMVRCEDRSLYTGIARDLKRRIQEHYYRKKPGAKYTKSHPVCSLAMVWEAESWSDAAKLEYRIKQLTKGQKETLLLHPEQVNERMSLCLEGKRYVSHPEITLAMCLDEKK